MTNSPDTFRGRTGQSDLSPWATAHKIYTFKEDITP